MRSIKFNVLDKKTRKIYPSKELERIEFNEKGEISKVWIREFEDGKEYVRSIANFKLLDFINSTDKNGKEIYVGHQLECEVGGSGRKEICNVKSIWFHFPNGLSSIDDVRQVEVIGNIHENPELLEAPP